MLINDPWPHRLDCERRCGNITGDQARVLEELWRCCVRGDAMPSERRLEDLAGVSRSTVQRAKARGRVLGLCDWERQRTIVDGLVQERPCAYRVIMPAAPCVRRERQTAARMIPRSVQQQLALIGTPTSEQIALVKARQARMAAGVRQVRA